MTRALTILVAVLALLAPGIVLRVSGSETRRDRGPDRAQEPRPGRPLTGPGRDLPALAPTPEGGACEASFGADIGGLLAGPGTGTWTTVSRDCSASPGCDDYFHLQCPAGALVQTTFCHHGGSASWDTGLSAWAPGHQTLLFCNDDACGEQSDMVWTVQSEGLHHVRIGGAGGASGPYTLAVNIPTNCSVEIVIPVELQSFEVE
jgi:hypothetical protein